MADVRINEVESQISVADIDALLTPEVLDRLVRAVQQRLNEENRMQRDDDEERRLVEGASR